MLPAINDKMMLEYKRERGQIYLKLPIVCEGSGDSDRITFIYDTGAFLTVVCREDYEWYGLDKLPRKNVSMSGYAGSAPGHVFQIPGLIIGQRLLMGVWAFTPKSMDLKQNLLGDNVIEYFIPIQDNLNDCIYFPDNPKPEPYIHAETDFSFACDSVMYVDELSSVNT